MPRKDQLHSLDAFFPLSIKLGRKTTRALHWANPFINILNMTDKSVAQYPDLIGQKGVMWRLMNSVMGAGVTLLRALAYWPRAIRFSAPKTSADVVIISHLTNSTHLQNKADFYFGDLADDLKKAGYKTHTILINHCRAAAKDAQNTKRKNTSLLPAFLSPWGEVKLLFRMMGAALSLPHLSSNEHEVMFSRNARLAQLSSRALGDYRIGQMLSKMILALKPRIILHTFEGHGWERVMSTTLRQSNNPPHIIGYQHAVVFPGEKSITASHHNADGVSADPDHIVTAGKITQNLLKEESLHPSISVLGSVKAAKHRQSTAPSFTANGSCLIAPEGTLSEVMIMSEVAIAAARLAPKQEFILRLHPVLNPSQTLKALQKYAPWPENFSLSSGPLEDDFARSSWLCYRGSTVAFQGLREGLRPIYLDPDDRAQSNDPISPKLTFRRLAADAKSLVDIIKTDQNKPQIGQKELPSALSYADNYVMPMKPKTLINHIKQALK